MYYKDKVSGIKGDGHIYAKRTFLGNILWDTKVSLPLPFNSPKYCVDCLERKAFFFIKK